MANEIWKLDTGWLAAYTEDCDLMQRIKRYKPDWTIMATYSRDGRLKALQYKVPIEQRRSAERMFSVTNSTKKQAI